MYTISKIIKSSRSRLFILLAGVLFICSLWEISSFSSPGSSIQEKASIEWNLSLSSTTIGIDRQFFNKSCQEKRCSISRYMLELYHRRSNIDIVRALHPINVSNINFEDDDSTILEFTIPQIDPKEILKQAKLLCTPGTIFHVRSLDERGQISHKIHRTKREDTWNSYNVPTIIIATNNVVKLHVKCRKKTLTVNEESPILVLSYSKGVEKVRDRRSTNNENEEASQRQLFMRRRNACRRRPLYIDFSLISYDEWIVAPPGYQAYQCTGKCFYPLTDHLTPTQHAIIQTLVYTVLQNKDDKNDKFVSRPCCVPTRLAPMSLLYLDSSGTLTYQYNYQDMVVLECGCR